MTAVAVVACLIASALAAMRWLRVAQREHYLAGSVTRFALRWWWGLPANRALAVVVVVHVVLAAASPLFAIIGAVAVAVGPHRLKLRGHAPGPMRWTRRLRTLAAVWAAVTIALTGAGALVGRPSAVAFLVAVATPALVDAALAITAPLEQRLGTAWVEQAKQRLRAVNPTIVAITGSYGKTSTKGYVAHLVQGTRSVVATPASFNNALGLARAVNENLAPGTEVFVAEMGTYGPGEIAAMVDWARPAASAITAIGPVHLERMKTEDAIAAAKSEILGPAPTVALNVDDGRLRGLADRAAVEGKQVVRCSSADRDAEVAAITEGEDLVVYRAGREIGRAPAGDAVPGNVAIAVALAGAVGVPDEAIARRLGGLPTAPNRRSIATGTTGATYIDDTYNSNPAGAATALATLERMARDANRVVVVTPGMVELGHRQASENERFAAAASEIATDFVVIGATNRKALVAGAHQGKARIVLVDDRAGATAWIRDNVGPQDVVLFENDLPDHFP